MTVLFSIKEACNCMEENVFLLIIVKFNSQYGIIGVFLKWNRTFIEFSEFEESDKSLKHELGSI